MFWSPSSLVYIALCNVYFFWFSPGLCLPLSMATTAGLWFSDSWRENTSLWWVVYSIIRIFHCFVLLKGLRQEGSKWTSKGLTQVNTGYLRTVQIDIIRDLKKEKKKKVNIKIFSLTCFLSIYMHIVGAKLKGNILPSAKLWYYSLCFKWYWVLCKHCWTKYVFTTFLTDPHIFLCFVVE